MMYSNVIVMYGLLKVKGTSDHILIIENIRFCLLDVHFLYSLSICYLISTICYPFIKMLF